MTAINNLQTVAEASIYCHDLGVIIDGVWIGECIYWPLVLLHTTRNYKPSQHYRWFPHFTNHYTPSLLQPAVSSLVVSW
jgi:hypothetical protein